MEQIRLDLIPNGVMPNVHASQFDHGRTIRFNLYEGESPFSLLATDYVKVACNNNISVSPANVGSSHDWTIPDSVVADSGVFIGELTIERDSVIVGSKNFVLNVEEDAYNGKNLEERTASGTIANFETNLQDNLTACKCEINALQSGTGTPSPNNPRPISGFNGSTIVRCGVNLFNPDNILKGSYDTATNNWSNISGSQVQAFNFDFKANTQYTFSGIETQSEAGKNARLVIRYTDGTSENIFADTSTTPTTFTKTSASGKSINFVYYGYGTSSTNGVSIKNFQIEYGTTAHDFAPFIGSQYAPYFEGLLNGSYGFVDLGALTNWVKDTTSLSVTVFRSYIADRKAGSSVFICSKYPTLTTGRNALVNTNNAIASWNTSDSPIIAIRDDSLSSGTADDFKTAMDGVYLIYELATPTTPTITQSQIDTLIRAFGDTCVCVVFGQTVYGGVLDVTNGKLKITHKYKLLTGDASETWYTYGDSGWRLVVSDQKGDGGEGWCNVAPTVSSVNVYGVVFGISTTYIYFAQTVSAWGCSTEAQLRTWLSNNNVEIVYPLATPTEITLTPKQIEAIVGINNVYHDCNGQTEVKYLVEV